MPAPDGNVNDNNDRSAVRLNEHKFFDAVLKLLRENPRGLNIKEIVDATGYDRVGLPHYMKALVDLGYVDLKEIGKMKIYYPAQTDSSPSR